MRVWIVSHKSITDSHKSQKWPFFSIRPVFGSPHTGAPHHHSYCYRHTVLQWRDESSRRCKKLTDYNSIRTEGNHELSVARATVRRQNEKTGQVLCATNPLLTLIHNSHHHDRNEDNYFCNGFQHPKVGQCQFAFVKKTTINSSVLPDPFGIFYGGLKLINTRIPFDNGLFNYCLTSIEIKL